MGSVTSLPDAEFAGFFGGRVLAETAAVVCLERLSRFRVVLALVSRKLCEKRTTTLFVSKPSSTSGAVVNDKLFVDVCRRGLCAALRDFPLDPSLLNALLHVELFQPGGLIRIKGYFRAARARLLWGSGLTPIEQYFELAVDELFYIKRNFETNLLFDTNMHSHKLSEAFRSDSCSSIPQSVSISAPQYACQSLSPARHEALEQRLRLLDEAFDDPAARSLSPLWLLYIYICVILAFECVENGAAISIESALSHAPVQRAVPGNGNAFRLVNTKFALDAKRGIHFHRLICRWLQSLFDVLLFQNICTIFVL